MTVPWAVGVSQGDSETEECLQPSKPGPVDSISPSKVEAGGCLSVVGKEGKEEEEENAYCHGIDVAAEARVECIACWS